MTKIIVDTNIIFSALLNRDSRIAYLLLNGNLFFEFYSPRYARTEIWEHHNRIKQLGNLSDSEFLEVYDLVLKNIEFFDHGLIPKEMYELASRLCMEIDENDIVFVAFAEYFKADLWTGDKKLINGLRRQNFHKFISSQEIYNDYIHFRNLSEKE